MSADQAPSRRPPIDSPITSTNQDLLGRAPVAHELAESIRELDSSEGLVVAVLGPWGHGKSSFVNLMKEQFAEAPALTVVDFNPWMFSGSDQLVNFFLKEIGAELSIRDKSRFGKVADWFGQYAGILEPIGGLIPITGGAMIGKAIAGAISGAAGTTEAERTALKVRKKITEALRELDQPIVVVIDDIDRLTTPEIREIFKLVRLTASFPNIIYVLAFDRTRIESALAEDGVPGRAYLEKIVLLSFDVPHVPAKLLRAQVFEELDRVLGQVANVTIDEDRWGSVYFRIIDPLIKNMRDVTRYAISSTATVRSLGPSIDLVDLLALEALRVFRPEVVTSLGALRSELTTVNSIGSSPDERAKRSVAALVAKFSDDQELVEQLIREVFPAARQYIENHGYGSDSVKEWRTKHQVAHIDFLNLYLDRVVPDALTAFRSAERTFRLLADSGKLTTYLKSLDPNQLEDVLQGLEAYENRFTAEAVVPGTIALMNLIDSMPKRQAQSIFDLGRPDLAVGRVVLRMFRRVESESEREALASEIFAGIETYSSYLDFLTLIGYREGAGHKLVSEEFARVAEADFAQRVLQQKPLAPSREWDALRVYWTVKEATEQTPLRGEHDAALIKAVFESGKSTNRSQTMGSGRMTETDVLAWDVLIEVFGDEDGLSAAASVLRQAEPKATILQLIDKYLGGWRPRGFGSADADDDD